MCLKCTTELSMGFQSVPGNRKADNSWEVWIFLIDGRLFSYFCEKFNDSTRRMTQSQLLLTQNQLTYGRSYNKPVSTTEHLEMWPAIVSIHSLFVGVETTC